MKTWWKLHGLRTVWLSMLALSLIVAVDALLGAGRGGAVAERVEAVTSRLTRSQPSAAATAHPPTQDAAASPGQLASDRVRSRYLFMPPPPEAFRQVQGVLGDRVLYPGGQSFAAGEDAMGAKVLAVGPDWVELEHRGEKIRIDVFTSGRGMPSFQDHMSPWRNRGEVSPDASQRERVPRESRRRPRRFNASSGNASQPSNEAHPPANRAAQTDTDPAASDQRNQPGNSQE